MIYWISTGLVSVMLAVGSAAYVFHKSTIDGVHDLGFSGFLIIEFAVLKVIAVFLLLLPQVPVQEKEWVDAGVALFYVTLIVAHYANGGS